ncbi:MAG: hypothetical protein WAN86_27905, partial [Hyphomicrobiaceae bacterium]
MPKEIPANTQAIITGWSDLIRVMRNMPLQCLIAVGVFSFSTLVEVMLGTLTTSRASLSVQETGIRLTLSVAEAFLLTPLLIGVHRLIILGERPTGYAIAFGQPRFMRFFGWSAALLLGTSFVIMVPALMADSGLRLMTIWVLAVASIAISIRVVLLFPALAVDAPGARWSNSWADTRGNGYDIFLVFLGAFVPLIVIVAFLVLPPADGGGRTLAVAVAHVLSSAVGYVLAVAIASRLYGWLADKLG